MHFIPIISFLALSVHSSISANAEVVKDAWIIRVKIFGVRENDLVTQKLLRKKFIKKVIIKNIDDDNNK